MMNLVGIWRDSLDDLILIFEKFNFMSKNQFLRVKLILIAKRLFYLTLDGKWMLSTHFIS